MPEIVIGIILALFAYCFFCWGLAIGYFLKDGGCDNRLQTFMVWLISPVWITVMAVVGAWDWLTEETS